MGLSFEEKTIYFYNCWQESKMNYYVMGHNKNHHCRFMYLFFKNKHDMPNSCLLRYLVCRIIGKDRVYTFWHFSEVAIKSYFLSLNFSPITCITEGSLFLEKHHVLLYLFTQQFYYKSGITWKLKIPSHHSCYTYISLALKFDPRRSATVYRALLQLINLHAW